MRKVPFVTGSYYHVFNRGVEKRTIFPDGWTYRYFLAALQYYQVIGPTPRLSLVSPEQIADRRQSPAARFIKLVAYCLMPNHYHLLLRQEVDGGIAKFIGQINNSYTRYHNTRFSRTGHLFGGVTKGVLVENEEQLRHLSRYIHLNPVMAGLVNRPEMWRWSSYQAYLGSNSEYWNDPIPVLQLFSSPDDYRRFVLNYLDYARSLEIIQRQLID